ncbi:hypothetical protein ACQ4LE_010182 [Meloidogyne hapla]|uniref:Transmembrane protein n=1 Tax=Meloidogyne hapla TaxID=6305 RepID=A0A1I8B3Y0_MELHA
MPFIRPQDPIIQFIPKTTNSPNKQLNLNRNIHQLSKNLFLIFLIINCYFCLISQVSSSQLEPKTSSKMQNNFYLIKQQEENDQNLEEEKQKYSFLLNSPPFKRREEEINFKENKKQKTNFKNYLFLLNDEEVINNKINKRAINGQTFIEKIIKGNKRRRELLKWKRGAGDFCGCNMGCFYHSMGLCASCCSLGL